jgi:hypothetical protein
MLVVAAIGCGSVRSSSIVDAMVDTEAMIDAPIDSVPDSAPDSAPDADLSVKYDIGYVDDFTISSGASSVLSFLLVVNKGVNPLNAPDTTVMSVVNDTPGANVGFTKVNNAVAMLASNRAAGALSQLSMALIVDSGLVTEVIDDTFLNFRIDFPQVLPPSGTTFHSQVSLRIDGKDVILPFAFHVIDNVGLDFTNVKRISSKP